MVKAFLRWLFGPRVESARDYPARFRTTRLCERCGCPFECRTGLPLVRCCDHCLP